MHAKRLAQLHPAARIMPLLAVTAARARANRNTRLAVQIFST
jgi:hypothetical protein